MNNDKIKFEFLTRPQLGLTDVNLTKLFSLLKITDTQKRRDSYLLSRTALLRALRLNKINLRLDNLFVIGHSQVHGFEHVTVSLSHTVDSAAAVSALKSDILALGVDIERRDRPVKLEAQKYFCRDEDNFDNYTLLEKWVIKEACYKAFSNLTQDRFLLKDLTCDQGKAIYNGITCSYELIHKDQHLIAIAYVPNI